MICQKAKKHKPMDSDEDVEESQNEPGTSSNTQPHCTSATSPAKTSCQLTRTIGHTDDDDEYEDGESGPAMQSARSHDSGGTVLYPDLHVLTNDEHWTVTPETHKYAAAAGSFCFVTTENGEEQDVCNSTSMPCVQRSLCLDEVTNDSSSTQVEVPKGVDIHTRL